MLELVYRVGVGIKGLDGLIEFAGGLVLWFAPGLLDAALSPLQQTDANDVALRISIARWADGLDDSLASNSLLFVILFLLTHGIVKIVLVYCLLKEFHWAYPYALGVLVLFAGYQLYVLVQTPTIVMGMVTALDVAIIWLVWREWRMLLRTATG